MCFVKAVSSPFQKAGYPEAAHAHGLRAKIHADEIDAIGGSELAGELGAISAEHLIAMRDSGIHSLKAGNTIACLLPATSFYLTSPMPGRGSDRCRRTACSCQRL